MATPTKTLDYAWPTDTASYLSLNWIAFVAKTITVQETTARAFVAAALVVTARQDNALAQDLTSWQIQINVGGAGWVGAAIVDKIDSTTEHSSLGFVADVTVPLAAGFGAGISQSIEARAQFGTVTVRNITCLLRLTYTANDAGEAVRTKTVRLPMESLTGDLGTVSPAPEIGTNQWPRLGLGGGAPNVADLLPEHGKTYHDLFLVCEGNEAATGINTFQLGLELDAEGETLDGAHISALVSSCYYRYIWSREGVLGGTVPALDAAHALRARSTHTDGNFTTMKFSLVVTYSYDHAATAAASGRVVNQQILPVVTCPGAMGGPGAGDQTARSVAVHVQEANPTLVQSGVEVFWMSTDTDIGGPVLRVNGQTGYRAYAATTGSKVCGGYSLMHRIDAGSAVGAFATLVHGENTLLLEAYAATVEHPGFAFSALAYVTYTSDIHAGGDGVHAHAVMPRVIPTAAGLHVRGVAAATLPLLETDYRVLGLGLLLHLLAEAETTVGADVGAGGLALDAERLAGEGDADGWEPLAAIQSRTDQEMFWSVALFRATDRYERWAGDPNVARLALSGSRKLRLSSSNPPYWHGGHWWLTYHAITYGVAGSVTGYTGDGSGITVGLHRASDGELLATTTTAIGGGFSFTWYDNTANVYCEATQAAGRSGRGDDGAAV